MSTAIQANVTIPKDCWDLFSALVEKLGGKLHLADDYVIVPPMQRDERAGRMLRGLRLRADLTQAQLAEAIGVPQSHISAYEKNKRTIPLDKAEKLAEILHTTVTNFQ